MRGAKVLDLTFSYATSDDLEKIHCWLIDQNQNGVDESLLSNWSLTQKTHSEGQLLVALDGIDPVAYLWGDFGILEVKHSHRRRGVGRALVDYGIREANANGHICLVIECAPVTSVPFWKAMGFIFFDATHAYYPIESSVEVSEHATAAIVSIAFYPESRKWDTNTDPIQTFTPAAYWESDRTICLKQRLVYYQPSHRQLGDPVLEVVISGNQIYLDKAKYEEARQIGVYQKDGAFAIEYIHTNNATLRI